MIDSAVTFGVVLPALLVAHNVADHWVQTSHQAAVKGERGWRGRWACARHVATYTMVTAGVVGGLWWVFGLPVSVLGFVVGQVVSAVSHYWADRRFTLQRLCEALGKSGFYRLGAPRQLTARTSRDVVTLVEVGNGGHVGWDNPSLGTGAYVLDQSWHWGWLGVAAFLTAVIT